LEEGVIMVSNAFIRAGVLLLAATVLLFFAGAGVAGPHGGGGHGGGHGGGGHGGGGHGGGHGGGGSHYHGGYYPYYHHYGYYDYPGFGIGIGVYPGYYGVYGPSSYYYDDLPYYRGSNVIYSTSSYGPTAPSAPAADRAYVTIQLPVDRADVWIEGVKSVQDKASQEYVSPPLEQGKKYYYEVRARWTDAKGKAVEAKREFPIYAGKPVLIDFTEPPAPPSEK
jgi:uncharacterized protein (TIGR03000 family)